MIISNQEMEDIMKIIKSLGDLSILLKGITKANDNETKYKEVDFLACCLVT